MSGGRFPVVSDSVHLRGIRYEWCEYRQLKTEKKDEPTTMEERRRVKIEEIDNAFYREHQ